GSGLIRCGRCLTAGLQRVRSLADFARVRGGRRGRSAPLSPRALGRCSAVVDKPRDPAGAGPPAEGTLLYHHGSACPSAIGRRMSLGSVSRPIAIAGFIALLGAVG